MNILVTMYHAMKVQRGSRGVALLILNLSVRWKWVVSVMCWLFKPRKEPHVPLYINLDEPQGQSGLVWRRENLLSVLEVESDPVQPVTSYCIDCIILDT